MKCPLCKRDVEMDDTLTIEIALPIGGDRVCTACWCSLCDGTGECRTCNGRRKCDHCGRRCDGCGGDGLCSSCGGFGAKRREG